LVSSSRQNFTPKFYTHVKVSLLLTELSSRQKPTNKQTKQKRNETKQKEKQRVCHTTALPFTLKVHILRQKKIYGNSNISPCKNIIFKKPSKRN
jgi:hypothetical protein